MISRVLDEERANVCDTLLTKLIQDERQYDNLIDENFVVHDWFKNVTKNTDNILLCYEEDNIIEGFIFLKLIESDNKKGYVIDSLYVDTMYRNQGIASKLMSTALDMIKDADIAFIDISVMANNKIAYNLYKKFGFDVFKINLRKNI